MTAVSKHVVRTPDARFQDLEGYPFAPNYVEIEDSALGTLRQHYLDEGPKDGPVILCMHGEPSWSYLYRKMIPPLVAGGARVIAPDLIGFGKSDKPSRKSDYSYARMVDWMLDFLDRLDLKHVTLFCQDWGGLIGLRLVAAQPDRFARIVVSNSGLPLGYPMPKEFMTWRTFARRSPVFPVGRILDFATERPISKKIRRGYDAPFPSARYKAGARALPSLVPITQDDPGAIANQDAMEVLKTFERPTLTLFGDSDPVTKGWDKVLQETCPGAIGWPHRILKNVGHFSQEDAGEELAADVLAFMAASPGPKPLFHSTDKKALPTMTSEGSITRALDVAHIRFALPDLEKARAFLGDFGLTSTLENGVLSGQASHGSAPLYLAEAAPEPKFIGFGIYVDNEGLERLAVQEAVKIEEDQSNGFGRYICLTDPDGFQVEVIARDEKHHADPEGNSSRGWNEWPERKRENVRLMVEPGPSRIRRLGHVVLNVRNFEESASWYEKRFGLIRSDEIFMGDPSNVIGSFMRCDQGDTPTDHHSVFLIQGGESKFEHAAFEVSGFNDLMRGHDHLKRSGAHHEWGVGRHILGSHVFDYWRDPFGFELEHWTDGDVLDSSHATGRHSMEVLLGTQWGEVHKILKAMQAQATEAG